MVNIFDYEIYIYTSLDNLFTCNDFFYQNHIFNCLYYKFEIKNIISWLKYSYQLELHLITNIFPLKHIIKKTFMKNKLTILFRHEFGNIIKL